MGKATGVFLILAGVGTAALVLPTVDKDSERQLADVIRIATGNGGAAPSASPVPQAQVALSPRQPSGESNLPSIAAPTRTATAAVAPVPSTPAGPTGSQVARVEPAAPMFIPPPQPAVRNANSATVRSDDGQAKQQLARDIQRELKRVGCYDGELSGDWNTGTKRAMRLFIEKVNAALPSDEPDHILRTMVQGHPGNACGRTPVIVAQAPRPVAKRTEVVKPEAAGDKVAIRPVEAASREQAAAQRATVPKPAWETSVAAVPMPVPVPRGPDIAAEQRVAKSPALDTSSRMAMGGPDPRLTEPDKALPKLIARESIAPAATAAGASSSDTSPATQGSRTANRVHVPGAIAALSQPRSNEPALTADEVAIATPPALKPQGGKNERDARSVRDARESREAREARLLREEIERRQRQSRRYYAAPQPFSFPSYVGAAPPQYFASQAYSGPSGTFSQRFFERQRRGGETR